MNPPFSSQRNTIMCILGGKVRLVIPNVIIRRHNPQYESDMSLVIHSRHHYPRLHGQLSKRKLSDMIAYVVQTDKQYQH